MAEVNEHLPEIERLQAVLDILEDGQALANLGFDDDDQEAVEEAYYIVKNRIADEKKIIVLDFDHYTANYYSPTEFIEEFAESAPTRNGVERIYQFDEDQMAIIDMRHGTIARKVESENEANEVLLDWALMDVHNECNRVIFAYTSKEQAIDFINEMIEDLEYDENFEAAEKCKEMKEAL